MSKRWGCLLLVVMASVWFAQGEGLRSYRNLKGLCGATGNRTTDREFALLALMQTKYRTWPIVLSANDYQNLLNKYPHCCTVRRGYDEDRLIREGVIWEKGINPSWIDRTIGSGYAMVTIDPTKIPVKEPYWNGKINSVFVYTDTCASGVDEGGNKRRYEG